MCDIVLCRMSEDEMEAEYVRLLKLARQRKEAKILSPDDHIAEKSRLSDMREGWIRRREPHPLPCFPLTFGARVAAADGQAQEAAKAVVSFAPFLLYCLLTRLPGGVGGPWGGRTC